MQSLHVLQRMTWRLLSADSILVCFAQMHCQMDEGKFENVYILL